MGNLEKTLRGNSAINNLEFLIEKFKNKGYLLSYEKEYKTGYSKFNNKQFYFQFKIIFNDYEEWLVQSTTTIRDRIDIQQWRSFNIKENNANIKRTIVVYPDSIKKEERKIANAYDNKILTNKLYSSIDRVVSLSDFYLELEDKAFETNSAGSQTARRGLDFESRIVDILNNQENLDIWNNVNINYIVGYQYPYFEKIVNTIGIDKDEEITVMNAKNSIEKLPSGGSPKTDIIVKAETQNKSINETISCKRTSKNWVTIHEYSVEKFIKVLGIKNKKLILSLNELQKSGGVKALSAENLKNLQDNLSIYNEPLAKWAYAGIGGEGDPSIHWARFILNYSNENKKIEIHPADNYISEIIKKRNGQLGTPFKWTYPSKKKGKSIQLKGLIL